MGGVGVDLVGNLALENPDGQVADVGEVIVEGLAGHAGGARETGDGHLRQGDGLECVAQGVREHRFRIGVGHRRSSST